MEKLSNAITVAVEAHDGQVYGTEGDSAPYIFHAIDVMFGVCTANRPVAVLHDVVEDSVASVEKVCALVGLSVDEHAALELLTRSETDRYQKDYIARIAAATGPAGVIAREVKLVDLCTNLKHSPSEKLVKRYTKAVETISDVMVDNDEPCHPDIARFVLNVRTGNGLNEAPPIVQMLAEAFDGLGMDVQAMQMSEDEAAELMGGDAKTLKVDIKRTEEVGVWVKPTESGKPPRAIVSRRTKPREDGPTQTYQEEVQWTDGQWFGEDGKPAPDHIQQVVTTSANDLGVTLP